MARTVDYLPFAINTGANVEGQSSYVIDPIRLTGHQAGTAKSAVVNKSLRQHSVMSAALANLLSEALDVDVLDDGDVVALKNMLQDVLMGGRSQIMTADLTLYVRTTGSNLNDGLTPTTAFATPQYAADYAYSALQLNGYSLTIDIGPGTFPGTGLGAPLVGQRSGWNLWFTGAGKGSTTISTPQQCFSLSGQAACIISSLRMTAMGGSAWGDGCLIMCHNANAAAYDVDFGPVQQGGNGLIFGNQLHSSMGAAISLGGTGQDYFYNISGGGSVFGAAMAGSLVLFWNSKFTLTGTPAYNAAFVTASSNAMTSASGPIPPGTGTAFSGAATGPRFSVDGISRIGGLNDPNFYPGSIAGYVVNGNIQGNYG